MTDALGGCTQVTIQFTYMSMFLCQFSLRFTPAQQHRGAPTAGSSYSRELLQPGRRVARISAETGSMRSLIAKSTREA